MNNSLRSQGGIMITVLKDLTIGTSLERPLRWLWRLAHPRALPVSWEKRILRDESLINTLLHRYLDHDSNCIDIGAHRGVILRLFTSFAPKGHHVAVEALPHLAVWLQKRFPLVRVFSCALGAQTGKTVFFHVKDEPGLSGLKEQSCSGNSYTSEQIVIDIRRLDDLPLADTQFRLIKIDVEGAEIDVLKGSERLIHRDSPIILFEHAKIHAEGYGTTPGMIYDLLSAWGYTILPLTLSGPLSRNGFLKICESSFESNYDLNAETNFIACPQDRLTQLLERGQDVLPV
jgi:FkbM family methyltransferase